MVITRANAKAKVLLIRRLVREKIMEQIKPPQRHHDYNRISDEAFNLYTKIVFHKRKEI